MTVKTTVGQTTVLKSWGKDGILTIPTKRYRQAEVHLDSLKRWLFNAVSRNDTKVVICVSNKIAKSFDNFLLSWKRITTSTGSKTAGVDKKKWKHRNFSHFIEAYRIYKGLSDENKNSQVIKPLRRIYIPKPDGSKRPLGIPTISDRFIQAIFTPAIEVINEVNVHKYKLNTFGFRDKIRAADAVSYLVPFAHRGKNVIVIDMDIAKCFDKISHVFILKQINNYGLHNKYHLWIEKMLKSGYMENGILHETKEGTPQGGVISPALCNLVVREVLDIPIRSIKTKGIKNINCVTYADDAVIVLSPSMINENWDKNKETIALSIIDKVKTSLMQAGLSLNETKTKIILDNSPFDFLGFEIRRGGGIRPSKKKLKAHHEKVMGLLRKGSRMSNVNAVIRGFYNYYANFSSSKMWKAIGKLDWYNNKWLWKKGLKTDSIITFTDIPKTTKYINPKKGATPLVQNYVKFFNDRIWPDRKKYLAKRQKDLCPVCNGHLGNNPTLLETHHVLHKGKGGKDKNTNVWLIHQSCHKLIHTLEE